MFYICLSVWLLIFSVFLFLFPFILQLSISVFICVCLSVYLLKLSFRSFYSNFHKYFIYLLKFCFIFFCWWVCLFMQLLHMSCIMSHSWANYTMCLLCTSFGWGNCLLPKTILFSTLIKIYFGKWSELQRAKKLDTSE